VAHHSGQQFGNYRLLRAVGNGGFATVYVGEHVHLGTQAAIKILKTQLLSDQREAFQIEARTIAHLVHPHIVRVLDFGLQSTTPFLVMEYAPHGSLRDHFPAGVPVPLASILPYVKQVADALQYAHHQQVIHRDVKPENMLLGVQDQVLLSDFGLAVIFSSSRQHGTFDMAGTIAYMAPEQIHGSPCPASDQYALGIVVYQWLTGACPFQGTPREILVQQLARHPPPLRAKGIDISAGVEAVIGQALVKEPRSRFASVEAFVTALHQAAQGGGQSTGVYTLRTPFAQYTGLLPFLRTPQHPLIGRERELEILRQLLQCVQTQKEEDISDERSLEHPYVSLTGDAGIGKTRLAEEISGLALQQGWAVLWGRAHSPEQHLVYRVWMDVLQGVLAYGYWPWQEVSEHPMRYQPLASLLPEVAELFLTAPVAHGENPEQAQFRIWDAILTLFTAISAHAPVLIILDDLHWADHASCNLLGYLVRNLANKRVLLIGISREQDISPTHPLRTLWALLQRQQMLTTLILSPLTASQVGQLIAHVPPSLAQDIQKQAAGNPFFAEELARFPKTLTEHLPGPFVRGNALPPSIIDIFEQRVAQLGQAVQKMLSAAAVLGNTFSFHLLCLMQQSGDPSEDEEALLAQLEAALRARLLLEEGSGMQILYHFWHPLLVEYLYTRLSAARRAQLHRRAARALEEMRETRKEDVAAAIVYHLVRGGSDPSLLIHYARQAGEQAHRLSAYPEAEQHYRLALAQLGEVASDAPHEKYAIVAHILECLGECTMVQGKFEEAQACYERTLELRDTFLHPLQEEERTYEAQVRALFDCEIGKAWHYLGQSKEAQQAYARGEERLREAGIVAGPAWAKIRFEEGYDHWRQGNLHEAMHLAHEALALFEQCLHQGSKAGRFLTRVQSTLQGNPVDLGRVYTLLAIVEATKGQITHSLQHLNAALEMYKQHAHLREMAVTAMNLADLYLQRSEHHQAHSMLEHACALAENIGDLPSLSVGYVNFGVLAARQGHLVDAEAWCRRAVQVAEQVKDRFYTSLFYSHMALLLVEQGEIDQARCFLLPALKISRVHRFALCTSFALVVHAHLCIAQARACPGQTEQYSGSLMRARRALQHAREYGGEEAETRIEGVTTLVEALFLAGSLQAAQQQARCALEDAQAHEIVWLKLRALHFLGTILTAQGEYREGDNLFQQALEELQNYGLRLEYARALRNYGVVLLQRSVLGEVDYQRGRGYLAQAWEIFLACDAKSDADGVKAFLH
jgi:tetratricopeptide (TPR) repeat protein